MIHRSFRLPKSSSEFMGVATLHEYLVECYHITVPIPPCQVKYSEIRYRFLADTGLPNLKIHNELHVHHTASTIYEAPLPIPEVFSK